MLLLSIQLQTAAARMHEQEQYYYGSVNDETAPDFDNVCYAGETLGVPGYYDILSPEGIDPCGDRDVLQYYRGMGYLYNQKVYYGVKTRTVVSEKSLSGAESVANQLILSGETVSTGLVQLLVNLGSSLICGNTLCAYVSATPTPTAMASPMPTPTGTPSPTLTPTGTPTPTATPGVVVTPVPTPTLTPTPVPTPAPTPAPFGIENSRITDNFTAYLEVHQYGTWSVPGCQAVPCPPMGNYPYWLGPENITLCGGCQRMRPVGDPGVSQSSPTHACPGNLLPWVAPYCQSRLGTSSYYNAYTGPGCFDGYPDQFSCLLFASSTNCFDLGNGKWCPAGSNNMDPVYCLRNGHFDETCMSAYSEHLPVNGGTVFCAQNTCNSNSQCICNYYDLGLVLQALIDGEWVPVTEIGLNMAILSQPIVYRSALQIQEAPTEPMHITVNDHYATAVFLSNLLRTIWFVCSDITVSQQSSDRTVYQLLPDSCFLQSGWLEVTAVVNGTLVATERTWLIGESSCVKYDCWTCWSGWTNWSCLSPGVQAFVVLVSIASCLIILLMLLALLYIVKKLLLEPLCCCYQTSSDIMRTSEAGRGITGSFNKLYALFAPRVPPVVVLLMCFCICADACSSGQTVVGEVTSCQLSLDGLTEDCSVNAVADLHFNSLGATTCLEIISSRTENTVASMVLQLDRALVEYQYQVVYYTSGWYPEVEERFRCNDKNVGHDCSGEKCSHVQNYGRSVDGQLVNPFVVNQPGETFCLDKCTSFHSSLKCLCPGLNPNCLYYGYGINPAKDGKIYSVRKLYNTRFLPHIAGNITMASGILQISLSLDEGTNLLTETTGMMLVPGYSVTSVNIDDKFLVVQETQIKDGDPDYFLCSASEPDHPTVNYIGDIQASSIDQLKPGTIASPPFNFDTKVHGPDSSTDKHVSINFARNGIDKLSSQDCAPLPGTYQGVYWYITSENSIGYYPTSIGGVEVILSAEDGYVQEMVASVCPNAKEAAASGCRSCAEGVKIDVVAKSDCFPGTVSVRISDPKVKLDTSSIYLSAEFGTLRIHAHTEEEYVEFDLTLIGSTETTIHVELGTIQVNVTVEEFDNGGSRIVIETDDNTDHAWYNPLNFLRRIFTGIASWWEYLLFVIFAILISVGLGLVLFFTWPLWKLLAVKMVNSLKRRYRAWKDGKEMEAQEEMVKMETEESPAENVESVTYKEDQFKRRNLSRYSQMFN